MHRFIKAVGAGQKRARPLLREEAREAMALVCDGAARPEQIGAFLLALRMKGEAADELAGFVDAIEARMEVGGARAPAGTLDVDCHGDGHKGRATLLPAAACALAALGVPVLLRLQRDLPTARHGLIAALAALGLDVARPLDAARARAALGSTRVAALDLQSYAAPLDRLVALRPLLGVRTVAQTLMKLLDPLTCDARAVGVFHAPYLPSTAQALAALGRAGLCVQALGGLPEAAPGKIVRVCRAGAEPHTIDLRALAAVDAGAKTEEPEDAAALNRAALDGAAGPLARAAAAAAILLHAARSVDPLIAAEDARRVLASGEARAVAARLADA
jgi:anthranilate phosphoribosyltransferase